MRCCDRVRSSASSRLVGRTRVADSSITAVGSRAVIWNRELELHGATAKSCMAKQRVLSTLKRCFSKVELTEIVTQQKQFESGLTNGGLNLD